MIGNYNSAHWSLRQARGRASEHACPCGEPARDWAYMGGDPAELTCPMYGRVYSLDFSKYEAMCRKCHTRMDRAVTQCAQGHELTPENTYRYPKTGKKKCRKCRLESVRKWQQRKKVSHEA